ncbi:MAG: GDSL family lipase [Silicimonas sp.]|nr:GDSL family lipase [Silicimonas sp.]
MKHILIYGDSNTFGTAPMRDLTDSPILPRGVRWGDQMAQALGDNYAVTIEGLPGRTTVFDDPVEGEHLNGLRILPAILHSHKPIDLLIIALGTNDQKRKFGLGTIDIALGVARLIREAMASGVVQHTLAICPPVVEIRGELGDIFYGGPERASDLPRLMERSAVREGAAFFDAGKHIHVDALDGVHWNAQAHASLGEAVAKVIPDLI